MSAWDLVGFFGLVVAPVAVVLLGLRWLVGRGSVGRVRARKDVEAARMDARRGSSGSRGTFFLR